MHKQSMRNLIRFYITNLFMLSLWGLMAALAIAIATYFNVQEHVYPVLYILILPAMISSMIVSFYITYKKRDEALELKLDTKIIIVILIILVMMIISNYYLKT